MDKRKLQEIKDVKAEVVDYAEIINSSMVNDQFLTKVEELFSLEETLMQRSQFQYMEKHFQDREESKLNRFLFGSNLNNPTPFYYLLAYGMYRGFKSNFGGLRLYRLALVHSDFLLRVRWDCRST